MVNLKKTIKCHSSTDLMCEEDNKTPVYCCAFLPPEIVGEKTPIGVSGGGHKICFIDIIKGNVIRMFQSNREESFYCLAVTSSFDRKNAIVAAAGKGKNIFLLNYNLNECFLVLEGHSAAVNWLEFHPLFPHLLFSSFFFINLIYLHLFYLFITI